MIALIHAYSRTNAGDALLVDLTLDRLRRLGIRPNECTVFALDSDSFSSTLPRVRRVGTAKRALTSDLFRAMGQLVLSLTAAATAGRIVPGSLTREIARADAVLAVGGGYLKTGTTVSALGTLLNHIPQLAAATTGAGPLLYLPQSIGPLRGPVGRLVKEYLRSADLICARDNDTVVELSHIKTVRRIPDLAVLYLAEKGVRPKEPGSGPFILIGRALTGASDYPQRLSKLESLLPDTVWATQALGHRSKSDARFYQMLGVQPLGSSEDVFKVHRGGVVVSVRLHGALMALADGIPAIHLSYERKGWGAYADLGIDEFVHDARTFKPDVVAQQALRLLEDPSRYWNSVQSRYEELQKVSLGFDRLLASHLG